jgi:hypothetical protein
VDAIDSLAAASFRHRIAFGPEAGRQTLILKDPSLARSDTLPKALTADQNGFSLNAASPVSPMSVTASSDCVATLRGRPSASSGFPPIAQVRSSTDSSILSRMGAVVPDAGKHLRGKGKTPSCRDDGPKPPKSGAVDDSDLPIAPLTWAQRLKRVFEFDITLCPHCGGRLRVIADVTDPAVIRKFLDHVHQRAPPERSFTPEQYAISSALG